MKNFFKTQIILLSILLISSVLMAHGMDKLGPNNGYIQMPGSFHTELVRNKDGSLNVYLLDVAFKNPMVKNSSVKAVFKLNRSTELKCVAVQDHFQCTGLDKGADSGDLIINATRDGVKSDTAIYKLPLKLQK